MTLRGYSERKHILFPWSSGIGLRACIFHYYCSSCRTVTALLSFFRSHSSHFGQRRMDQTKDPTLVLKKSDSNIVVVPSRICRSICLHNTSKVLGPVKLNSRGKRAVLETPGCGPAISLSGQVGENVTEAIHGECLTIGTMICAYIKLET